MIKKIAVVIVLLILLSGLILSAYIMSQDQSIKESSAAPVSTDKISNINTKYATVFFYWHWCGDANATRDAWRKSVCKEQEKSLTYKLPGFVQNDPQVGAYGERNYSWVKSQLKDMESARLDYVLLDTWKLGNKSKLNSTEPPTLYGITPNIKKAITEKQTKLKFGLLIESGGIKEEYVKRKGLSASAANSPLTIKSDAEADLLAAITNEMINYFFTEIPKANWATDKNNRPYVLFFDYQNNFLTESSKSQYLARFLWRINTNFKSKFKRDVANVVIWEWLYNNINYSTIYNSHMTKQVNALYGTKYNNTILGNITGSFSWSTYGNPQGLSVKNLTIGNISPGFNKCNWLKQHDPAQSNNCDKLTDINKIFPRSEGKFLESNFLGLNSKVKIPYDLVILESWGEGYEGTTLQRTISYPKYDAKTSQDLYSKCNSYTNNSNTTCLPGDFYIKKVNQILSTYGRYSKK